MSDDLVKQSIAELQDIVRCRCHPAYKDRGMHDPDCECDSADAVQVVINYIAELEEYKAMYERQASENFQMYVDANEARIDAETSLAKVVEALDEAWYMLTVPHLNYEPEPEEPGLRRIKTALAAVSETHKLIKERTQ